MEKKISSKIYFAVYVQIFLMISLTFTFSYIMSLNENTQVIKVNGGKDESIFLQALKIFNKIFWNEDNLVSATSARDVLDEAIEQADNFLGYDGSLSASTSITAADLSNGIYTCPKDNNGRYCQEYPSSSCSSNCNVSCIPTPAAQSAICRVGTCYDSKEGSCSIGSPRQTCENSKGLWFSDPLGNINVCSAGCCVLGEKALFITETQCTKESSALGIAKIFRPELKTEISCLALSKFTQKEGACLVKDSLGTGCRFTTETNCKMNIKGEFYENYLCSHPDFETKCTKQKTTGCVEGKDEVYWFDSCGNRENIYSVNKEQSYNDGRVLSKENSCILDINNKYSQSTCGNCDRFTASVCGAKTASEKLSESNAGFVCKDLRCKDEKGETREHGESWCAYQSSIGLDVGVNGERATNTPGARSFKKTCYEGEILTDPCVDYTNEICTQSEIKRENGEDFSTAACRTNRGYECYQYNEEGKKDDCTKNPDCFIKEVAVGAQFKFGICAPKYSLGFDFEERESSAGLCAMASQKCDVIEVKGLGGWKCKANCACKNTQLFAEQMNDLCISLGDCGTKANYQGDLAVNHKLFYIQSKKGTEELGSQIGGKYGGLSNNYINKLTSYANEKGIRDNFIEAANLEEFYGELGIPGTLNPTDDIVRDKTAAVVSQITTISGAAGLLVMAAGTSTGISVLSSLTGIAAYTIDGVAVSAQTAAWAGEGGVSIGGIAPTLQAFSGALTGAAIGFTAISMLIKWAGIGAGIPEGLAYALMGIGAVAGAVIGISIMGAGTLVSAGTGLATGTAATASGAFGLSAGTWASMAVYAWYAVAAIVVLIAIMKIIGIGKVRHKTYTFQCLPWQAPNGGSKCSECGSDGYPCSKYSCKSLGQNCELINENTQNPECISVARDDISAPLIRLNESYLASGFSAEHFENGVKIKTNTQSGCIPESYSILLAGIDIDESARCELLDSASEVEGGEPISTGLYKKLHVLFITVPPLSSFGLESFNPNASSEKTYHVRCEDKNGNKNVNTYAVNFCVMPGKDIYPPQIIGKEPYHETVRHDATEINASIFTNEPAECKWSNEDKNYENMENDFVCLNELSQRESLKGWRCIDTFDIDANEKTFFVRCKDQPWVLNESETENNFEGDPKLMRNTNTGTYGCYGCEENEEGEECVNPVTGMQEVEETSALYCDDAFNVVFATQENNTERNVNNESYVLKFIRAENALNIDSINVDGGIFEYNTTPASVELIVKTSGGLDGSAKCSYMWGTQEIPFFETFAREHKQISPAYQPAKYELTIKCEDPIGETAEKTAYFEIKIDDSAPKVTRAYSENGMLYIITDERANCFYNQNFEQNCYFDIKDKNASMGMIGADSIIHSLDINYGSVYNIKCTDEFGHYPGDCSVVIKGVEK